MQANPTIADVGKMISHVQELSVLMDKEGLACCMVGIALSPSNRSFLTSQK